MAKNSYTIEYLPSFDREFGEILSYITYKMKNKHAAEKLLKKVSKAIMSRSTNPEGFEIYKSILQTLYYTP